MRFLSLIIVSLLPCILLGQNDKNIHSNSSLIKNYSPKTYKANPQTFSIIQDNSGVMYFANQLGVVEYDGVNWGLIKTGDHHVLKLTKDNKGQIYVLCDGDFGLLTPNNKGQLIFQSKIDLFKTIVKDYSFLAFKSIIFDKNIAYIKTSKGLYRLKDDKVSPLELLDKVVFIKKVDEIIYIQRKGNGLQQLENDSLKSIHQGELLKNDLIVDIIKFNNNTYIITEERGILKLSENQEIQIQTPLSGNIITSSKNNRDIHLILGTSSGILILNKDLSVYKKIGIDEGISDPTIKDIYLDFESNLWVGSQNGISKIEIDTPIEIFNKKNSLNGSIEAVEGFNNTIFCATGNGVYYLNDKGTAEKVKNLESDCYGLTSLNFGSDSILLVAEVNGIYQIDQKHKVKEISSGGPYMFKQSPLNNNEIFTIHYNGLSNFIYERGTLVEKNYIKNFSKGETHNFLIQENGTIWIGTLDDGVYQTTVNSYTESSQYKHYYTKNGLPKGQCYLFEHDSKIYAGTNLGLFVLQNEEFILSTDFSFGSTNNMKGVHRISKDEKGNIWAVLFDEENNYEIGFSTLIDGKYEWNHHDFIKHSNEIVHGFYHSTSGNSWFGGPNGLIKYDNSYLKKTAQKFNCLLRKISLEDSLLYGGSSGLNSQNSININFSGNIPITIEYAAPTFIDEEKTVYSFFLEGYNNTWSDWSSRTLKEYNLYEGTYTFHVKAKNVLGKESDISSYSIIVSPPWYRTILAFISYIIIFILLIYGLIKLSVKRVAKLNKKLEDTVLERTKEIVEQKEMVEEKNQEIMDSMTYAKRIQNAILPPSKMIKESLKESFVLYKPKDIVAGDFYWLDTVAGEAKNKATIQSSPLVLFAAADCTGHGVPGAMVSVVCNNGLNRSFREFGLTDPGEILTKTREIIIQEFGKSDEDVKDGMDIALCSLKGNTLKYAGANNPLWIIRDNQILETKANKQPIGQFDNPLPFTTHTVELQTGDSIYIFSDGYVDQFGGPKGKKYKTKAFRVLLLSIQDKSMEAQKIIIEKAFEDWKGDLEQVDDVCIIGVRV
jgi:serine phosphatase RsbU (regulator of sigma subunit)/ligand-binding sensor domain-containing protein